MKYVMKRNWISMGDAFHIADERGRDMYRVDGATFLFGRNLTFYDLRDSELAYVSRKTPESGTAYEIYHGDDLQAVVRKDRFSADRLRFSVEGPGPDDLHAEGNLGDHEYTFMREGKPVGRVSKNWFRAGDTYGIAVDPGEDDLLLLASSMVIDLCCHLNGHCNGHSAVHAAGRAGNHAGGRATAHALDHTNGKRAVTRKLALRR